MSEPETHDRNSGSLHGYVAEVWVVTRLNIGSEFVSHSACNTALRGNGSSTKKEAWEKFRETMRGLPGNSERGEWSIHRWKKDGVDAVRVKLTADFVATERRQSAGCRERL